VIAAQGVGDFGEIPDAVGRDDGAAGRRGLDADNRQPPLGKLEAALGELRHQGLVERGDAVIVETCRHGAEHRHGLGLLAETLAVALVLLAHVAQRIGGPAPVELVDGDKVGEVEHVDLLQLRSGTELGRHDVERNVDQRHDRRVALADAGGLDHDQVEAGHFASRDHVRQGLGDFAAGVARRQRAHVDIRMLDRVHADAVAQQRAAGALARGVDRDHGDFLRIVLVEAEAADQLVGQRGLAGAAGAGDTKCGNCGRRRRKCDRLFQQRLPRLLRPGAAFQRGDDLRQIAQALGAVGDFQRLQLLRRALAQIDVAARHHVVDHALQAHGLAVLDRIQVGHAIGMEVRRLGRHDDAAATAEDLDVRAAALPEQVDHVLEVFDVAALVGRHRDALHVFLQSRVDDLIHRTVVAEVDHLGAGRLQDAPHDVDRGVMAVEQRGGGDEAHLVLGLVGQQLGGNGKIGHGTAPGFGDGTCIIGNGVPSRHDTKRR
jgi:hypothetical protein